MEGSKGENCQKDFRDFTVTSLILVICVIYHFYLIFI